MPQSLTATHAAGRDTAAQILVVDDNDAKRLSIRVILEPLGYTIADAESGEAALREVMDRTFAVILMDVNMPMMDGYETARLIRMRRDAEHTPIVFVTAAARDEVQIPAAYASGAIDFMFAPVVPEILRAKVSIFVELFLKSRQLLESEARSRAVLDNVADGIVTVGDDGLIESFNRAATDLFGYGEEEAIGLEFSSLAGPTYPAEVPGHDEAGRQSFLEQHGYERSTESVGRRLDGSTFPIELVAREVEIGARSIQIACLRDLSERRTHTQRLRYVALHDDLTDLPNRVLFGDRVEQGIRAAARMGEPLALLVLDLDEFKRVNDTLGHQCGDLLLRLVSERLLGCLRDSDTVARLGGDEFGILPAAPTDLAGAAAIAWKVQQALEPAFVVHGVETEVNASIGIALLPDHGDNIDDLLRRADLAMYDAKQLGSGYAVFAAAQEEIPARRLALLDDLRRCVSNDELVLHYQPKVDLATLKTIGVEALLRWNHPSGRLIMPNDFMGEVERSELMVPITAWVLNEALRQLRTWREANLDLTIAVNVGARCLAPGAGFFELVEELTDRWTIPPDRLTLELTESALIDTAVPGLLTRLEDMGERLSIDDFGTGYSSLVYLQRLPVAEIKADRSFVTSLTSVGDDAVIVRSIIDLAHNLGVKVVAEGVEDETTMRALVEYGCDAAQGYHFSRPISGADLTHWLATSSFGLPRFDDETTGVPALV